MLSDIKNQMLKSNGILPIALSGIGQNQYSNLGKDLTKLLSNPNLQEDQAYSPRGDRMITPS